MEKRRKLLALMTAVAIFFVMLSAVFYIVVEVDHDCKGHDCPICEQISICENTLKNLCVTARIVLVYPVLIYVLSSILGDWGKSILRHTLITLKVKLSN